MIHNFTWNSFLCYKAYKLTDLTTPVKLTVHKGVGGVELGSQEFAVK